MVSIKLIDIIREYQNGNKDLIILLLNKFEPNIKKLSRKLNYECSETDLVIYFIELIDAINISKLTNTSDGAIVKYIDISLKRKSIYLYKLNSKRNYELIEYNDDINSLIINLEVSDFELSSITNCLNYVQKKIIIDKYINKYTDSEIAHKLGISRQSVYSNKVKALNKLKKYYL